MNYPTKDEYPEDVEIGPGGDLSLYMSKDGSEIFCHLGGIGGQIDRKGAERAIAWLRDKLDRNNAVK